MKHFYLRKSFYTTILLLTYGLFYTGSLIAQTEWCNLYPEDWKNDSLYGSETLCLNYTKGLTWYSSGYIYSIIENNFDYTPDNPSTSTPWVADEEGSVEDYEGNTYKTLRFGDTWWLAENLRTKSFADGTQMQKYVDWNGSCDGGYSEGNDSEFMYAHANDDESNDSVYGCLYNWYVGYSTLYKKKELLKDSGWVVPDTMDFYNLVKRFGLWDDAESELVLQTYEYIWTVTEVPGMGLFIKSDRNTLWETGSPRAGEISYNASGLCFPPAGQMEGSHSGFGNMATIWTAVAVHWTPHSGLGRRYYILDNNSNTLTTMSKGYGMARSLRLVKRIKRTQNDDGSYSATKEIAWTPGYIDGVMDTDTSSTNDPEKTTQIAAYIAGKGIMIWGIQGNIMVKTDSSVLPVEIYNINGTKIKTVTVSGGIIQIPVNKGFYIVRTGGISKKVITY